MKYEELYKDFAKLFPDDEVVLNDLEISADVDEEDGMHILFGMVVFPFISKLVEDGENEKLKRVFDFLEQMASSKDSRICEVLEFTILENIITSGKDFLNICKPYMGSETGKSCEYIERYLM